MSREQKLYSEVEKHLGMKVPANVWRYLKQKHYVEEAIRWLGMKIRSSFSQTKLR